MVVTLILVYSEEFILHLAKLIKYRIVLRPLEYSIFLCFISNLLPVNPCYSNEDFCCFVITVESAGVEPYVTFIIPSIYILENSKYSNSIYDNRGCGMMY